MILLLALAGTATFAACGDAGGVDPDAIDSRELAAVRIALDSAFRNNPNLDSGFTGDSGLYVLMSQLVFLFIDRASFIVSGPDTTRAVAIEMDIDATQGGEPLTSNLTVLLAWTGYDTTSRTVDSVYLIMGAGRAPINDSLWSRFTLDTAGTGTGFVVHQAADSSVTTWLSRGGHLVTTASSYGSARSLGGGGSSSFKLFRGMVNGNVAITAKQVPDSTSTVTALKDFGSGTRAIKIEIRGSL